MSLGAILAAHELELGRVEIALAVEQDAVVANIYRSNLERNCAGGASAVRTARIETIFDGELGARQRTKQEQLLRREVGDLDVLMGGPPCQGHSDLNNHTRRSDARNVLYESMGRAAEVLQPRIVIVENVPAVVHDRGRIVDRVDEALSRLGYSVAHAKVRFERLGAPQRRRRHLLIALRDQDADVLAAVVERLEQGWHTGIGRTVEWAVGDLVGRANEPGSGGFDAPSRPSPENCARLAWFQANHGEVRLPDQNRPACHRNGGHSYNSIYGRLAWDEPAQTITTGFGSMGQGRYVHPSEARTITPHEAARLQTFPDFFLFDKACGKRTAWAKAIGNAVPPLAMREVVRQALLAVS
ncbi:DNA cytosine methyltransferase [bacterium]|nr:DNA cytosine methyltransferase [bacterium]